MARSAGFDVFDGCRFPVDDPLTTPVAFRPSNLIVVTQAFADSVVSVQRRINHAPA
jgi:hypothetical protein